MSPARPQIFWNGNASVGIWSPSRWVCVANNMLGHLVGCCGAGLRSVAGMGEGEEGVLGKEGVGLLAGGVEDGVGFGRR